MDERLPTVLVLINGIIVMENSTLTSHVLLIYQSRIHSILPGNEFMLTPNMQIYDCKNKYILPGLIDIHSDVIENTIVPRKGIVFDPYFAIHEIDRQLLSQGITTMYHSISIANSTICNRERTMKVPNMLQIGKIINQCNKNLLINHRFHARLELSCIEAYEEIREMLLLKEIHELSFMDHTPGQGQYFDIEIFKREILKQYGGISELEKQNIIEACMNKPRLEDVQVEALLSLAHTQNVPIAYHDVDSEARLTWMDKRGIDICEFPINENAANVAQQKGFHIVVGAPNILLDGSHNNNASAKNLLKDGVANIICSDYYSEGLLLSVFKLHTSLEISLSDAVRFVTINPAKAVRIDCDYGSIAEGKIADIIIVDANNDFPFVSQIFIEGKEVLTYQ